MDKKIEKLNEEITALVKAYGFEPKFEVGFDKLVRVGQRREDYISFTIVESYEFDGDTMTSTLTMTAHLCRMCDVTSDELEMVAEQLLRAGSLVDSFNRRQLTITECLKSE